MIIYLRLPKNFASFSNEVYGFEDYVICSDKSIKMEIQKFISVERKKEGSKQTSTLSFRNTLNYIWKFLDF